MNSDRPASARTASSTPPEPFLLGILHHLLSPFPSPLPPALLSHTTRQAIHYLSVSPDDEAYWTCGRKDDQVALRRQELVEAGNLDDLILSHPRFSFDLDETKALISLSLPHSDSSRALGVVLVWEDNTSPLAAATGGAPSAGPGATAGLERKPDEDDIRPGWTFLELQQVDESVLASSKRHWHSSLADAVEATTSSLVDAGAPARDDESARAEENRARFAEAAGASDCEGTTPGGIGSANDFWAGWSDDEGDSAAQGKVVFNGGSSAQNEDDADDDYWSSYGTVDSQVGGEEADQDDDRDGRGRDDERAGSGLGAGARAHRSATITPATAGLVAASSSSSPSTKQQPSMQSVEQPASPSHRDLPPPPPPADTTRSSAFSASQYSSTPSPRTLTYPSSPSTLRPSTPPPPSHERSRLSTAAAASASAALAKSPQRPAHTRKPSDVTKALPSFPAFPVLPRTKSNSALPPGTMYPASAPTSPKAAATRSAAPASSVPADKSLPPAPSPALTSQQQLHVQHRPETFAPQYAHLIPVGRDATAHMAGAHEAQQQQQLGSRTAPLPPSAKFPESPSSSSAASFGPGSGASPTQHALEHAHPGFLAEAHEDDDAEERVRLDRLASVGSLDGGLSIASTSLTSMLLGRTFSNSTGLEGDGEHEHGAAGSARHFPLPPSHSGTSASGDGDEQQQGVGSAELDSLRFAMAGLWGLFAGGARTPAERAERRRLWERLAAETPRS
ncbi:hypothetical protein JCM9279_001836 [Rhodotorula babjevae]